MSACDGNRGVMEALQILKCTGASFEAKPSRFSIFLIVMAKIHIALVLGHSRLLKLKLELWYQS